MPYIYNSGTAIASNITDNLQPINVPPVNRYLQPWGLELKASTVTGEMSRHTVVPSISFVPIKVASTITVDRLGLFFTGANSCTDTWYYDFALYTHNSTNFYPNTKIADLGTITYEPGVTANGAIQLTINATLNANTTYWLAIGIRTNAAFPGTDFLAGRTPHLHQQQGDFQMFRRRGLSAANTQTGGMAWAEQIPSYSGTLPTTTAGLNSSAVFPVVPRVVFRRSA